MTSAHQLHHRRRRGALKFAPPQDRRQQSPRSPSLCDATSIGSGTPRIVLLWHVCRSRLPKLQHNRPRITSLDRALRDAARRRQIVEDFVYHGLAIGNKCATTKTSSISLAAYIGL